MRLNMEKSGNPTLNPKNFQVGAATGQDVMTQQGAFNKTAILLVLCIGAASFTWGPHGLSYMWIGLIGGLIMAMVTIFKKEWAPITAPLYALLEGVALGGISYAYNMQTQGIVFNAIMLTFAVMAIMLFVYSNGIIKVTDKLKTGIFVATGSIMVIYLVSFVMGFFGSSIPMIHSAGPIGIGFSVVVVGIAAFNLLIDFDFIERAGAQGNLPKYMEWYGAFALMVTLVWLYLEILRLLNKLNRR